MTARAGGSDWQYAGVVTEKEAKVLHECVPGERQHDDLLELGAAVELRRDVAVLRQHVSVRRLHKQQQTARCSRAPSARQRPASTQTATNSAM